MPARIKENRWKRRVKNRLKALRKAHGLRLVDLALATGMSKSHLSNVECDKRELKPSQIAAVAAALQETPDAIIVYLDWPRRDRCPRATRR